MAEFLGIFDSLKRECYTHARVRSEAASATFATVYGDKVVPKVIGYKFKHKTNGWYKQFRWGFTDNINKAALYTSLEIQLRCTTKRGWGGKEQGKWRAVYG